MKKGYSSTPRNSKDSANRLWRALLNADQKHTEAKNDTQTHYPSIIEMLGRVPAWVIVALAIIAVVVWIGVLR